MIERLMPPLGFNTISGGKREACTNPLSRTTLAGQFRESEHRNRKWPCWSIDGENRAALLESEGPRNEAMSSRNCRAGEQGTATYFWVGKLYPTNYCILKAFTKTWHNKFSRGSVIRIASISSFVESVVRKTLTLREDIRSKE